jgi:hypothetical protein
MPMGNITPWGGMFFVGGNAQQKHLIPDGASSAFPMGNITPWGGMFFVGGNAQQKHLIPDGASPPEISCNEDRWVTPKSCNRTTKNEQRSFLCVNLRHLRIKFFSYFRDYRCSSVAKTLLVACLYDALTHTGGPTALRKHLVQLYNPCNQKTKEYKQY